MTRRALPVGLAPAATALAGMACVAVAYVVAGAEGALGAGIGAALVLAFLWTGIVPLLLVRGPAAEAAKGLAAGLLILSYTLRLAVALAVLKLAGSSEVLSQRALGVTVIVTAAVWVSAQLVRGLRHPDPA